MVKLRDTSFVRDTIRDKKFQALVNLAAQGQLTSTPVSREAKPYIKVYLENGAHNVLPAKIGKGPEGISEFLETQVGPLYLLEDVNLVKAVYYLDDSEPGVILPSLFFEGVSLRYADLRIWYRSLLSVSPRVLDELAPIFIEENRLDWEFRLMNDLSLPGPLAWLGFSFGEALKWITGEDDDPEKDEHTSEGCVKGIYKEALENARLIREVISKNNNRTTLVLSLI